MAFPAAPKAMSRARTGEPTKLVPPHTLCVSYNAVAGAYVAELEFSPQLTGVGSHAGTIVPGVAEDPLFAGRVIKE